MMSMRTLRVPSRHATPAEIADFERCLAHVTPGDDARLRLLVRRACSISDLIRRIKALKETGDVAVEILDLDRLGENPKVRRAFDLVGVTLLRDDAFQNKADSCLDTPIEAAHDYENALNVILPHAEALRIPGLSRPPRGIPNRPELNRYLFNGVCLLDLGRGCTQACRYCFQDTSRPKAYSMAHLDRQLALASEKGLTHVILTGGEFFCHPQWKRIVKRVGDGRFSGWGIFTNGSRLAEPGVLDFLLDHGMGLCQVSFDTPDAATQNHLSQNPHTFETLEKSFAALADHPRLEVLLCAVVTTRTLPQLARYPQYVADLREKTGFSPALSFAQMIHGPQSQTALVARVSDVAAAVQRVFDACDRLGLDALYRHIPLCLMRGREAFSIDVYNYNTLLGADGEAQRLSDKAEIRARRNCPFKDHCPGLTCEYAAIHGTDEVSPSI